MMRTASVTVLSVLDGLRRLSDRANRDPGADVLRRGEREHLPERCEKQVSERGMETCTEEDALDLVGASDETSGKGEVLADQRLAEEARQLLLGEAEKDEGTLGSEHLRK